MGILEPDERHRGRARSPRLKRTGAGARAVVVHSLSHALAALSAAAALGVPVTLMSGPGAAGYAGPDWFLAVLRQARARHPGVDVTAILDCAEAPGRALAALRRGAKAIRLGGSAKARARVAAIALAMGARLDDTDYALLNLGAEADPERAVRKFLKAKP
jgi:fructose/tagatose bisphosphate aldolase